MRDAELPDRRELLAAFAAPAEAGDEPVTRSAAMLAELHRQRHRDPLAAAGIDCRRAELVAAVDRWVGAARPARVRGISLGALLDRMAAAHVHADHLLHHCDRVSDTRVHTAWYRLATLADEWSDLIAGYLPERASVGSR
ncbi:DUF4254 domain-containing protein [Nocardia sp. NPDC050697]|uniref:DUF4254 domain-containing protein n=1 Tax=Nocardia sp. NPDC050697 TaxID=3155158 RepID=UPI0033ECA953